MKKILFLLAIVLYINSASAQTKEKVFRVPVTIVSNSSGQFPVYDMWSLDFAGNGAPHKETVTGNVNTDFTAFFWVYPTDQIDVLLRAKDTQIALLQAQLNDLKASVAVLQHSVAKLKKQVKTK